MGLHFGGNGAWSGVLIVRKRALRAKTRYVACAPAMSRVGGAAHARMSGRTCAEVGPWRTRKVRAKARARKHAGGVLPAHGNKQPIDRYRVAQNLMEHGHGERE